MENTQIEENGDSGEKDLIVSWKKVNEIIAGICVLLIVVEFPLVFHNYYFDILKVKYTFYYVTILATVAAMLIAGVVFLYIDSSTHQWGSLKWIVKNFSIKSFRKSDWAMIAFLVAAGLSTLQSDYFFESFWGNEGRYMGMFLILMYGISFFIITRCFKFKQWYLDAFLGAGVIVCVIGIMQFFMFDPIGFKDNIDPTQFGVFTSTIGNINTYTSYVALISGMGVVLFAVEKNVIRKTWYLITVIVSFFALITGISDNAYLALGALLGLLPLYLFKNLNGVKKYVLLLSILSAEFQMIDTFTQKFPNHTLEINGLFEVVVKHRLLGYCVAVLWVICILLYILDYRLSRIHPIQKGSNAGRWIWLGFIILGVVGVGFALYDVNVGGNADKYGGLNSYLLLNDDWGTHRGYIWRIGMESFENFPITHKIFGYGPDTFGIITVNNFYNDMVSRYNEVFDSAHNEYLQYLITIGIVGLIAYLSVLIISVVEIFRVSMKKPVLLSIVFAIICYGAQAAVNISVPIVAPIMMTLLMMGLAASKAG